MSFFEEENVEVVSLVECRSGRYILNEETLAWISAHTEPFAVITCAGKYRTGDSVQACTKGIWVYKKFMRRKNSIDVLLMDTEGIDALDADDTHDVRIFTLALLMCSSFLYNSVGHIDEAALQTLSLMTRVTNNIQTGDSAMELNSCMPRFYWILRDFSLRLESRSGKTLSADQYLEEALDPMSTERCEIREVIRSSFVRRNLLVLQRPSCDDSGNQRLEDRPASVSQKFTLAVNKMADRLFTDAIPLRSGEHDVTGSMYVEMCRYFVETIQGESVPIIQDSWTLMSAVQARDCKDALFRLASARARELESASRTVIIAKMDVIFDDTLDKFDETAQDRTGQVRTTLIDELQTLKDVTTKRLGQDERQVALELLGALEEEIRDRPLEFGSLLKGKEIAYLEKCPHERSSWHTALYECFLYRWVKTVVDYTQTKCMQATETSTILDDKIRVMESKQSEKIDDIKKEYETRECELMCQLESALEREQIKEKAENDMREQMQKSKVILLAAEKTIANLQEQESQRENERVSSEPEGTEEKKCNWEEQYATLDIELKNEQQAHAETNVQLRQSHTERQEETQRHKQVEISWKRGLVDVQKESKRKIEVHEAESHKLRTSFEQQAASLAERERKITVLESNIQLMKENTDREILNMSRVVEKSNDHCDNAEKRALAAHKTMLEEFKKQDERIRSERNQEANKQIELEAKLLEAERDAASARTNAQNMKRRLEGSEEAQRECKRSKSEMENSLLRLQTQLETMQSFSKDWFAANEKLRLHNLKVESQLAVLQAEREIDHARRTVASGNK